MSNQRKRIGIAIGLFALLLAALCFWAFSGDDLDSDGAIADQSKELAPDSRAESRDSSSQDKPSNAKPEKKPRRRRPSKPTPDEGSEASEEERGPVKGYKYDDYELPKLLFLTLRLVSDGKPVPALMQSIDHLMLEFVYEGEKSRYYLNHTLEGKASYYWEVPEGATKIELLIDGFVDYSIPLEFPKRNADGYQDFGVVEVEYAKAMADFAYFARGKIKGASQGYNFLHISLRGPPELIRPDESEKEWYQLSDKGEFLLIIDKNQRLDSFGSLHRELSPADVRKLQLDVENAGVMNFQKMDGDIFDFGEIELSGASIEFELEVIWHSPICWADSEAAKSDNSFPIDGDAFNDRYHPYFLARSLGFEEHTFPAYQGNGIFAASIRVPPGDYILELDLQAGGREVWEFIETTKETFRAEDGQTIKHRFRAKMPAMHVVVTPDWFNNIHYAIVDAEDTERVAELLESRDDDDFPRWADQSAFTFPPVEKPSLIVINAHGYMPLAFGLPVEPSVIHAHFTAKWPEEPYYASFQVEALAGNLAIPDGTMIGLYFENVSAEYSKSVAIKDDKAVFTIDNFTEDAELTFCLRDHDGRGWFSFNPLSEIISGTVSDWVEKPLQLKIKEAPLFPMPEFSGITLQTFCAGREVKALENRSYEGHEVKETLHGLLSDLSYDEHYTPTITRRSPEQYEIHYREENEVTISQAFLDHFQNLELNLGGLRYAVDAAGAYPSPYRHYDISTRLYGDYQGQRLLLWEVSSPEQDFKLDTIPTIVRVRGQTQGLYWRLESKEVPIDDVSIAPGQIYALRPLSYHWRASRHDVETPIKATLEVLAGAPMEVEIPSSPALANDGKVMVSINAAMRERLLHLDGRFEVHLENPTSGVISDHHFQVNRHYTWKGTKTAGSEAGIELSGLPKGREIYITFFGWDDAGHYLSSPIALTIPADAGQANVVMNEPRAVCTEVRLPLYPKDETPEGKIRPYDHEYQLILSTSLDGQALPITGGIPLGRPVEITIRGDGLAGPDSPITFTCNPTKDSLGWPADAAEQLQPLLRRLESED